MFDGARTHIKIIINNARSLARALLHFLKPIPSLSPLLSDSDSDSICAAAHLPADSLSLSLLEREEKGPSKLWLFAAAAAAAAAVTHSELPAVRSNSNFVDPRKSILSTV